MSLKPVPKLKGFVSTKTHLLYISKVTSNVSHCIILSNKVTKMKVDMDCKSTVMLSAQSDRQSSPSSPVYTAGNALPNIYTTLITFT